MSTRRSRGYAHLRRARSSFSAIFLVLTAASSRRWRRSSVVRRLMAGAAPSNTNTGLMLWNSNLCERKEIFVPAHSHSWLEVSALRALLCCQVLC